MVLIWEGCSNYAGNNLDSMQVYVITIQVTQAFSKSTGIESGIDRYTLIEQSDNYAHWQALLNQCSWLFLVEKWVILQAKATAT